ncbi:MAG: plasmid stabilization protein [Pseudorhodobacter sp. PARRP1]|nr:MAG: plasmid stabilization protein [Pseudorhodobacter sp. PARRP1]
MTAVVVSPAAEADLGAIIDHYLVAAGIEVAAGFMTAWDRCMAHLEDFPASGSPRLAEPLDLSELRVWPVKGFPQLALYTESESAVILLRVLHSARDLPFALRD